MSKSAYRIGGTRGGQDQFKWEDVKSDNYRENYLGHSLQAPVGRWQRGKDLKWWNKKETTGGAEAARAQAEAEMARIRQQDDDLLNQALGLAPRAVVSRGNDLSKADLKQLLEKGATVGEDGMHDERISGLGAAPAKVHDHLPKLTLKERELQRTALAQEKGEADLNESNLVEIVDPSKEPPFSQGGRGQVEVGSAMSRSERRRAKEEKKSSKKEQKKQEKKKKKNMKKEAKNKERDRKKRTDEGQRGASSTVERTVTTLAQNGASENTPGNQGTGVNPHRRNSEVRNLGRIIGRGEELPEQQWRKRQRHSASPESRSDSCSSGSISALGSDLDAGSSRRHHGGGDKRVSSPDKYGQEGGKGNNRPEVCSSRHGRSRSRSLPQYHNRADIGRGGGVQVQGGYRRRRHGFSNDDYEQQQRGGFSFGTQAGTRRGLDEDGGRGCRRGGEKNGWGQERDRGSSLRSNDYSVSMKGGGSGTRRREASKDQSRSRSRDRNWDRDRDRDQVQRNRSWSKTRKGSQSQHRRSDEGRNCDRKDK
ncbi:unnamed protein product [Choristocarpus tenellus]